MGYDAQGIVKSVGREEVISEGFRKREFVITVEDGKYPYDLALAFTGDSISKLDPINQGDVVEVAFNLKSNEHHGKWYTNARAWKIDVLQQVKDPGKTDFETSGSDIPDHPDSKEDDHDSLPF